MFPCLMLFLTVLSFNLIGDRLARRFDIREAADHERTTQRHESARPRPSGARCSRSPT